MKKHIRAFVSLLCAAALALGCASCGGAAQSTGKSGGTAGVTHITVWGDRIFEKCGIGRDERGDGGKTLEIRGKRRLSARDGGANYQQS